MANFYCSSAAYATVAVFAINTTYTIGQIIRQLATPAVGSERCFRCTTGGTTGGSESAWTTTKNSTTTQGTAVFTECTGQESYQTTSWAAPFARLATALSTSFTAAGDTIYVASSHAETSAAAVQISVTGTYAAPNNVICVTRPSTAIPPVAADVTTGASLTTTGTTSHLQFDSGSVYFQGITFSVGTGSSSGSNITIANTLTESMVFENCTFALPMTAGATQTMVIGRSDTYEVVTVDFRNVNITPAAATFTIQPKSVTFTWKGGTLGGATGVTNLIAPLQTDTTPGGSTYISSVDLSILGASQYLVRFPNKHTGYRYQSFANCKLGTALGGVGTSTILYPNCGDTDLVVSDSTSGLPVREEHYRYAGSVVSDTANYRTSGATDGTSHKSWKFVSLSTCNRQFPLDGPDIFQWVATTGSKTVTMYLSNIAGTTLKDVDFGLDIEYMGASTTPLGTFATTLPSPGPVGSALTTDTQPWTGQGGLTKQRVAKTFTVNKVGWFRIRPRLTLASTTLWFDPLVVVT